MSVSKLFLLFFILGFSSCDFSTRIDTAAAVKEMKAKQVKRVLPEQIVNQVDTWGLGVQKEIEKKLGEKSALDLATLSKKYGISILVGKATELKTQVGDQKIKEISKNHIEIDEQQLRNYREVFKGYFEPLKLNILND